MPAPDGPQWRQLWTTHYPPVTMGEFKGGEHDGAGFQVPGADVVSRPYTRNDRNLVPEDVVANVSEFLSRRWNDPSWSEEVARAKSFGQYMHTNYDDGRAN